MEAHREKDTQANSLRLELAQTQSRLATATAESAAARASILEQQRGHEESERSLKETHAQWVAELRTSQEKSLADLKQSFAGLSAEALAGLLSEDSQLSVRVLHRDLGRE